MFHSTWNYTSLPHDASNSVASVHSTNSHWKPVSNYESYRPIVVVDYKPYSHQHHKHPSANESRVRPCFLIGCHRFCVYARQTLDLLYSHTQIKHTILAYIRNSAPKAYWSQFVGKSMSHLNVLFQLTFDFRWAKCCFACFCDLIEIYLSI